MTPTRTHAGEQNAPRMYTRGDAMRILRIGETSLHWLTRTGKLQTVRIGGRVLIPAVELDRLCRKGATLSEAEKRAARNNTERRRVRPRQPQEAPL
jgi:helix-turn-helix protein